MSWIWVVVAIVVVMYSAFIFGWGYLEGRTDEQEFQERGKK